MRTVGISPKEISEICERVSKWARGIGEIQDRVSFRDAAILADAMAVAARDCGIVKLSPEALGRLLGDVLGSGVSAEYELARSGGPIIVAGPEAALGSADTVIWWDFSSGTANMQGRSFWSKAQRRELAESGIGLPESQALAIQIASRWTRPILAARKHFLAVSFEADCAREPEMLHPLVDQLLPAINSERKQWLAAVSIKPGLSVEAPTKNFEKESRSKVVAAVFPDWRPRHDWKIKPGSLALREKESPSALEKALGCLLSYALHYGAKLRSGPLENLSDGNQLAGKIAHKIFQEVFSVGVAPSPDDARKSAAIAIENLLPTYAASLLGSEQRWLVAQLSGSIIDAAGAYAQFLNENKLDILRVETEKSDTLLGATVLSGTPDHVLGSQGKPELIMDHKWGGGKYKLGNLRDGTSLQLAMYAYLERTSGKFPSIGYFIIEDQEVMVVGEKRKRAQPVDGPEAKDVFASSVAEIIKRVGQLSSGNISADGVHEDQKNAVWKAGCVFCSFGVICGKNWGNV